MTENMQNRKIKISDEKLLKYIKAGSSFEKTLFLDLGVKKVRLLCYSEEFIPHIEKQLTFVLSEKISEYDATIVLWKEDDVEHIHEREQLFDDSTNIKHIIIISYHSINSVIYPIATVVPFILRAKVDNLLFNLKSSAQILSSE